MRHNINFVVDLPDDATVNGAPFDPDAFAKGYVGHLKVVLIARVGSATQDNTSISGSGNTVTDTTPPA